MARLFSLGLETRSGIAKDKLYIGYIQEKTNKYKFYSEEEI